MALEYFLYTTAYTNTLIERSNNSFAPLPPNTGEIHIDYFIPNYQPLYYYRESGGTIVINSEADINAYILGTAAPPQPEDPVEQQEFTGYTATTEIEIGNKIDKVSGAEGQVPVFITGGNLESSNYTISELLNQYANVLIVAKSGATYSTITSAISVATSDDVIYVKPGIYDEDITISGNTNVVGSCGKKTKLNGKITFTNSSNSIIFKNFGFYNENDLAIDIQCGDDDGKISLIDCYLDTVWNTGSGQSLVTSKAGIKITRGQLAVSRGRYTVISSGDNTSEHNTSIFWLTGSDKIELNSFGAFNTITNTTDSRQNLEVIFNVNSNTGSSFTFKNGNIRFYGVVNGSNYVAPFYSTEAAGEFGIIEGNLIEINDTGNAYCAFNYDADIETTFSNNSIIPNNVTDLYAAWSDSGIINVVQCYFDTDSQPQVSGNVNYGITNNVGTFLSGKLSVDNKINLGTYNNTTGTDGDFWWTGNELYIRSGSTAINLLSPPILDNYVEQQEFTGYTASTAAQIAALSGGSVNIDTVLTVAPSGASFSSIQGAIDSVTDASTTKRYLIEVYSGTYTEDISMKNYVFVKGQDLSTVKVNGNLTITPFGFGFSKLSNIEFTTQDRPTAIINTIGLATFEDVVLSSNWTGNTTLKSVMNIQKGGLVQMIGGSSTMRLTDNYTGATQTRNYVIVASGSSATNFNGKNNRYQQDIYGNTAELGLVLHTNPNESDISLDDYDFNLNLHGSAPVHLIKFKNIEGGNGEIEASDATTYIDSDNPANITALSAYISGATLGSYIDYTTSKFDWSDNIDDEDIYIGAAVTGTDGIRVLNVVFETEGDIIPELYTGDGNLGEHFYSIYNGVGTSYNSETTITSSLILGGVGGNVADDFQPLMSGNSTSRLISEAGIRAFASDPENIIYSNSGWTGTSSNVGAYLDETTDILDTTTPTGYIYSGSPIQRTSLQEVTVFAGEGYINSDTLKHVTWTGETIDTSAYALGQWYVYVDINGTVFTSQSNLDSNDYIKLGGFLQIAGRSATVVGSGRNIDSFGTKVMNNFERTTAFIYDKGGKVGVTGTTSVVIEFPPLKVQDILDDYDITDTVYSTQGGSKFFTWFYTTDAGWIQNYDFYRHAGGEVNLRLWNDTSGVSNYLITGGSLGFENGEETVTADFDLSTELMVGYYIYLQSDGIETMNRIAAISGNTLTLSHQYTGATTTGTTLAVTALLDVPDDKYVKHLVFRDFNGIADLVYNNTYQDTLADIKSEERFELPNALGESVVRLAEIISSAAELSYEVYLNDIRPIPHGDYAQTAAIDAIGIHGELAGLSADDHLQYLRTDGTRDLTGIQSYDSNKTFTSDTNLITKKYVDDKKYNTGVITGGTFNANIISGGTFTQDLIPNLNASIITGGTLLTTVIPDLNASIITGGTFIDIVTPSVRPPSDGTTALQIKNATGGTIVNFDTISGLTGFGTETPNDRVHIYGFDTSDGDALGLQKNGLTLDGAADMDKDIKWAEEGVVKWLAQTYREEDGEFWYLWNQEAQNGVFAASRQGRVGINKNTNILNSDAAPVVNLGLDDIKISGLYTQNYDTVYEVEIDSTGNPDTFKWRKSIDAAITFNAWSSSSGVTTGATELEFGVEVQWLNITGHTVGMRWRFAAFSQAPKASLSVAPMQVQEVLTSQDYDATTIIYNDITARANGGDYEVGYTMFSAGTTGTQQAFYWGNNIPVNSMFFNISQGDDSVTLIVEYYNGSSWVAMDSNNVLFDLTNDLSNSGAIIWSPSTMTGWIQTNLPDLPTDEYNLYWMRMRTSTNPTNDVIGENISIGTGNRFAIYTAHNDFKPSTYVDSLGRMNIGGGNIVGTNKLQINTGNIVQSPTPVNSIVEIDSENSDISDLKIKLGSDDNKSTGIRMVKTRGDLTNPTGMQTGDELGHLIYRGFVGVNGRDLAKITANYTGDGSTRYGDIRFSTANGADPIEMVRFTGSGTTGFGITTPTALIHLKAGSTTIAPLKFNTGNLLTTPQEGAVEFDGSQWYGTITGDTRKTFAFLESPVFTGNPELPVGTTLDGDNLKDFILSSGGSSGTGFVTTTNFNTYTGDTDTRLDAIDDDITYISGVTDTKLPTTTFNAYTGSTIPWTQVSKTGSDLADLEIRNAEDVDVTLSHWVGVDNVDDYVQKSAQYLEETQGSGRIAPEEVLSGGLTQTLIVSGGTGYIAYEDFFSEISWSAQTFNVSGYTEGTYYVYVDTNSDIQISATNPDGIHNIRLGFFYWGGSIIGIIQQCGCVILNSMARTINYMLRQGTFIYDGGGEIQLLEANSTKIVSPAMKIQFGLLDTQLSEIDSTDAATFKFSNFYKSADADWEVNYFFPNPASGAAGGVPTLRWNDTSKDSKYALTGYTLSFTNGSNTVTSTSDLTTLISAGTFIFKTSDTHIYMTPVTGVTWTGSETQIILKTGYSGTTGSGEATVDYALPFLDAGKFVKHLILRSADDNMYIIFGQQQFDTEDDAIAGGLPSIPSSIEQAAIKMAYIVAEKGDTDLTGKIYDIRPLPYQFREGGQTGGGTTITVHGELSGLGADDHLQYLRTDGTRALTGIQKYQSQPTFTTDLDIVSKKYVDDADNLKTDKTDFDTYTGTTAPDTYLPITDFNSFTGTTDTRITDNENDIGYISGVTDTKLDATDFNTYSGATDTRITDNEDDISYISGVTDTKLFISDFNTLTGTTLPANYYNKTEINIYTGTTATLIGTKANLSGGAAFTGTITVPKPSINDNTTCVATTSWYVSQAGTATPLTNGTAAVGTSLLFARQDHRHATDTSRLAVTDFNIFTNTTLPANYYNKTEVYNKTEINSYTGTTATLIGTKLDTTTFNTYTGNTIGVTASRKFSAGKLNDQVLSGTQGAVTNWNTEESFSNSEFYSWDAALGELTILQDGVYHINFDISILGTVGTSRSEGRSVIQEDVGAGFVDISYTEREYYVRQLNYGASTNANYLREYSAGDKIRATAWEPVGTTTLTLQGDGTLLTVVKSEVGINTLQYTGTTDQFVEKTDFNTYTGATQTALNAKQDTITGAATTITTSNLTASRALVSDASGKVGVSTVTSAQLAAVVGNVYGTEFQLVESNASSTSTATTPQTKVSMTTTNLPAGTYKIFAKWRFLHTSASNSAYFDITVNGSPVGTQTPFSVEPKDTTNVSSLTGTVYETLSGVNTILLRYWNEASSTTISDASIELIRVS